MGRADAVFHQPWIGARLALLGKATFPVINLGVTVQEIRYGIGSPPAYLKPSADTVPFVRATDIKDGEISTSTLLHIAAEQPKSMEKCQLKGGELIIVRSGVNTGDCAVVPFSLSGAYAAYDLILTFQPTISAHFVSIYLDSDIGRLQMNVVRGRAAQPHINAEEVSALQIPLPTRDIQDNLVAEIDLARAERRAKLAEAEALLAGLDGFILSALGLTPPSRDNRQVFSVQCKSISSRFDPNFHLPIFAQNATMLADHGAEKLGSLVSFSNEVWIPEKHKEPTFRYIEISTVNPDTGEAHAEETAVAEAPSRARMVVRTHDIIVSLTRPHHGSIALITPDLNGCVASTGFAVLRNISESHLNREYLWSILRTQMCLSQMIQRASGGNYPAITEAELGKVLIPVPQMDVQEIIASEVRLRSDEARRLREAAESDWQSAKRRFEEHLLGDAST